jgi:Ca-activated chloride channel family protein
VTYRFADPWFLTLLVVLPLLAYWYVRRRRVRPAVRYSAVALVKRSVVRNAAWHRHTLFGFRTVGLLALIVALARPQSGVTEEDVRTHGIDIVLALDLSSSMLAEDLQPTRIDAAKAVAAEFVEGRPDDRIGLVAFAGDAFTQAPLTLDHDVIVTLLSQLTVGMIDDGTAIGMGLATAVKRLEHSDAKSRIIVLLTDGRNNRGEIDPLTAAQMAQALGIKIYTIGAGTRGMTRVRINDPTFGTRYVPMRVDIDEGVLKKTADLTGGRYFRATDRQSLETIYHEIDQLEKTEIAVQHFTQYGELFPIPLTVGLGLIVLELLLGQTVWRTIP